MKDIIKFTAVLGIWETVCAIGGVIFLFFVFLFFCWIYGCIIALLIFLLLAGGMTLMGWLLGKIEEIENWGEEKFPLTTLDKRIYCWKIKNWEKEKDGIKELCQVKYRYGEDSPEFEYLLDKQSKIFRRPRMSTGYGGGPGLNFRSAEPIGAAKAKLRGTVNINFENWCEKFVGQHTQNSRVDEKETGKTFEEE